MGYYDEFNEVLSLAKKERDISAYLKSNLELLRVLNEHSWNCVISKAEFHIGTQYIADFIILSACSNFWNCVLIEMQSPCDKIYNKDQTATKELKEAERQLQEWQIHIETYQSSFRDQLAELAHDLPAQCSNVLVHRLARTELRDPKIMVRYRYKILIGRRAYLNEQTNRRRATTSGFEIVTFDRILDYAKRRDEAKTSQNLW